MNTPMLPLRSNTDTDSNLKCGLDAHPSHPIHAHDKTRCPIDKLSAQCQTLVHPTVTLHIHPQHDPAHQEPHQHQHRPDSPTSLEDSQSESGVDTLSVGSTDSADYADLRMFDHSQSIAKRITANGCANTRCRDQDTVSGGLISVDVNVDGSATSNGTDDVDRCNNSIHVVPGLMMATPPLSPTRPQFLKESSQDRDPDEDPNHEHENMPLLDKETPTMKHAPDTALKNKAGKLDERRRNGGARARAGSAPPTIRATWPTRAPPVPQIPATSTSAAVVAVMPPRIPVRQVSGQGASSAWTTLLPGVAPIRVNPRPVVRTSGRSTASHTPKEQRQVQQQQQQRPVPILLAPDHEVKLTMEMYSLFESLLPTEESHRRRTNLISKIERIVQSEWSGQDIKVLPFGSTVNDLGTNTSDVDVCIWTSWLGLQGVEMLADTFRKHGMDKVFCVPEAKVPIVKLWDPELQLSCDMNINTQLGIMNSRMVRTYVAIDPRVRPFAMIIKHWARKRVLNDAANGGTISTYTWICMVINFLQMRSPPILPSLHDLPHELSPDNQVINGNNTSFFSDLAQLEGFGSANKESLGGLLYAFFRKFAIEFDYDHHVISVRHACYLTKESKGWHNPGRHYRLLCVEEPFDTTRNLGNSCDMASSRGLKQEFRRALDILNHNGTLDEVCEQWVFPPCYYHNNVNNYSRVGGNGHFVANSYAAAGRRYVNGFRPHNRALDTQEDGDADAEDTRENKESSQISRKHGPSTATRRNERNSHEKRSRSISVSRPRDHASSLSLAYSRAHDAYPVPALPDMVDLDSGPIKLQTEEGRGAYAANRESRKDNATTSRQAKQSRSRQERVHSNDDTAATTLALAEQADKLSASSSAALSSSSPSSSSTLTRSSKSTNKNHGGNGFKGNGSQRNGRSGAASRDGHGARGPRPAVELCLADIAKIAPQLLAGNKTEDASEPSGTSVDGSEKKKKCGKKSVLWSTNSSRGDSRGNHAASKGPDQAEQRTKHVVAKKDVENAEAGP
ncbi:hypothetical protein BGX28_007750 [Mortierella sp. GBA30]|nr:hypothetical protein BGX28_007750 [Mortierella sp. GBA30]